MGSNYIRFQPQRLAVERLSKYFHALLGPARYAATLVDENGWILASNRVWDRQALEMGCDSELAVGFNYFTYCTQLSESGDSVASLILYAADLVLRGLRENFQMEYPRHSQFRKRWYRISITPLSQGVLKGLLIMKNDISRERLDAIDRLVHPLLEDESDLSVFRITRNKHKTVIEGVPPKFTKFADVVRYAIKKKIPLEGTDLCYADLQGIDFSDTCLDATDFRGSNLQNCKFESSSLITADFHHANLQGASFVDACLFGASFRDAEIAKVKFHQSDTTDVVWSGARFDPLTFLNFSFEEAILKNMLPAF